MLRLGAKPLQVPPFTLHSIEEIKAGTSLALSGLGQRIDRTLQLRGDPAADFNGPRGAEPELREELTVEWRKITLNALLDLLWTGEEALIEIVEKGRHRDLSDPYPFLSDHFAGLSEVRPSIRKEDLV
jgi:hypothetical protein